MLVLFVLGRTVEPHLGPWKFVGAYIAVGAIAEIGYLAWEFLSTGLVNAWSYACIGASGPVYGIAGLHYLLAPGSRMRFRMLVPLPRLGGERRLFRAFSVPTECVFAFYLLPNAFSLVRGRANSFEAVSVAGFLAGLMVAWLVLRRREPQPMAAEDLA